MGKVDTPSNSDENDRLHEIVDAGMELAGGGAGAVIGSVFSVAMAGPTGIFAAGVAATAVALTLRKVGAEITDRVLAKRETLRVGMVLGLTAKYTQKRLDEGDKIRDDGFFDTDLVDRSEADEVFEGVLIKCQQEHEERKLPYLSHLITSFAFNNGIGLPLANHLLKVAGSLTYRQLCLLEAFKLRNQLKLRTTDYSKSEKINLEVIQVLDEIYELTSKGLVSSEIQNVLIGIEWITPSGMKPVNLGMVLCELMCLKDIPSEDIHSAVFEISESQE